MNSDEFIEYCRTEINEYFKDMKTWTEGINDVREVLLRISAYSATASQFSWEASKSNSPQVVRFSENELKIFLNEIEFQFKVWSRIEAVLKDEWEMSRGQ